MTASRSVSGGNGRGPAARRADRATSPELPSTSRRRTRAACARRGRPVIPESRRQCGRRAARKRPPCRSPWNTPCTSAPSRKERSPARRSAFVSIPRLHPFRVLELEPGQRSITAWTGHQPQAVRTGTTVPARPTERAPARRRACSRPRGGGRASSTIVSANSSSEGQAAQHGEEDAATIRGQPRQRAQVVRAARGGRPSVAAP